MKNILIISNENDASTNHVIDWLYNKNINIVRINRENSIKLSGFSLETKKINFQLQKENKKISLNSLNAFWYRQGRLNLDLETVDNNTIFNQELNQHLYFEKESLINFILISLEKKHNLGNYFLSTPNKLHFQILAVKCGLEIPDTYIFSTKKEILMLFKEKNLITKPIQDIFYASTKTKAFSSKTERVSTELINSVSDNFFPSLIQEELTKKYELRIFFMKEKFYPMAIFSQNDDKTSVDFRNYNRERPNRMVPYELPEQLEKKLTKLVQKTGLNTGSIDIVVTKDNRFVFLEINPVGQFGMVSYNCNYFLEREIADYLIKNNN